MDTKNPKGNQNRHFMYIQLRSVYDNDNPVAIIGVSLFNRGKQSATEKGADTRWELVPDSQEILSSQDGG
jgi:hypothetical protein